MPRKQRKIPTRILPEDIQYKIVFFAGFIQYFIVFMQSDIADQK